MCSHAPAENGERERERGKKMHEFSKFLPRSVENSRAAPRRSFNATLVAVGLILVHGTAFTIITKRVPQVFFTSVVAFAFGAAKRNWHVQNK